MSDFITRYRGHLMLHGVVLIFGFTAILGELISVSPMVTTMYRVAIGFAGLVLWQLLTGGLQWVGWSKVPRLSITGVLISVHWICFFKAIEVSNVSVTLAALSSTSLFTALVEPLLNRRRVIGYEVLLGTIIIVGLGIIFQFEGTSREGLIYGVISAALAAIVIVINGQLVREYKASTVSLYELGSGFIVVSGMFALSGEMSLASLTLNTSDLTWLLILGLVCTSFAYAAAINVMRYVSAFTVSMTVNLEPIYGILMAVALFGSSEFMSPMFYLGAVIVLGAVFANAWLKNKSTTPNV